MEVPGSNSQLDLRFLSGCVLSPSTLVYKWFSWGVVSLLVYKCFSWGVVSLLEGKSQGVSLVQLCTNTGKEVLQ